MKPLPLERDAFPDSVGEPVTRLKFTALRLRALDRQAWDEFAHRCGAGFRSSSAHLQSIRLKGLVGQSLQIWQAHLSQDGCSRPIAQCAVIARSGRFIFYDGLQLLPESAPLWSEVMAGLLAELGPGEFEYGWEWNLEPPREKLLAKLPGVNIVRVRSLAVHGVDFSRWPDWPSYYGQVRKSVRYEARAAEARNSGLRLAVKRGLASAGSIVGLMNARAVMLRRKGVDLGGLRALAGHLFNATVCPDMTYVATVGQRGRVLAWYLGFEFGELSYYWAGARASEAFGAGWRLLLEMLKQAHDRSPNGKFLMGYVDCPDPNAARAVGLLESRKALRISEWPTSRVRFTWRPPPHI